jgi:hypothetical protein
LKFNGVVKEWGEIYVIGGVMGELVKCNGEVLNEIARWRVHVTVWRLLTADIKGPRLNCSVRSNIS